MLGERRGFTELAQVIFECGVVAPDDSGVFRGDGSDAFASQHKLALGVESVRAAGDRARVVDEARSGFAIEQGAGDGAGCRRAFANAFAHDCGDVGGECVDCGCDSLPLDGTDTRRGCESAAAIVAPLAARPVAVRGCDLVTAPVYCFLDLDE